MTYRAVEILRAADFILAEDTRQTGKLLSHFGISTRMVSFHMHNEHRNLEKTAAHIAEAQSVALVSDAGTPGISDPGFLIVRHCVSLGIRVECLPGATACIPAIVSSGFPCDRFVFEGFLPHKKGRQTRIQAIAAENRTQILYESPHRLAKALSQLAAFIGTRPLAVCRELSKFHEEVRRGTAAELADHYTKTPPKGECVIVIGAISGDLQESGSDTDEDEDDD